MLNINTLSSLLPSVRTLVQLASEAIFHGMRAKRFQVQNPAHAVLKIKEKRFQCSNLAQNRLAYSNITIMPHQSYIPLAWTQEKGKELEEDDNLTEDVKLRRRPLLTRFDPAADSHPSRHRSSRREVQFEP
jgi:hypothetical protein